MSKVLIIDPEDWLREMVRLVLEQRGFKVADAANGPEGIALARAELPDLILCEAILGELDGYQTLAALRGEPTTAAIPFIMMAAHADQAGMKRSMELGADDYLPKPFTIDALYAAVEARLRKVGAVREEAERKMAAPRDDISPAIPDEMRAPLRGILANAELLAEAASTLKPEEIAEMSREISQSTQHLKKLIEETRPKEEPPRKQKSSQERISRAKKPRCQIMYDVKPVPAATAPVPLPVDENVQFTVFRPDVVEPAKWHTLLAFTHLTDAEAMEEVAQQARQVLGAALPQYQPLTQDSNQAVPRAQTITLVPVVPEVTFNPPQRSFVWSEPVQREEFRLMAAAASAGRLLRGRLTIYLGAVILAEINLTLKIAAGSAITVKEPRLNAVSGQPYRRIFASYSHKDLAIVEQFERFAGTLGDRYLRDHIDLRAGEKWEDGLKQLIHEADVFQLFWSHNSMRSKYVRAEWEYALGLNRSHFIRPTYWEDPLPAAPEENLPPDELTGLHFQKITIS